MECEAGYAAAPHGGLRNVKVREHLGPSDLRYVKPRREREL